jgi:thiosulfate dehydrogenase [quinone] large subunit
VVTGAEGVGVGAAARDAGSPGRGDTGEHADGAADVRDEAGGTRERVGAAAAGAGAAAAAGLAARRADAAGDVREGATDLGVEETADPATGAGHGRAPEDEPAWNRPSGVSPITRSERRAAEAAAAAKATGTTGMAGGFGHIVWALTRVLLGFVFLWAFLDRLFGLGLPTPRESAWRDGGSPTTGYLDAVEGPLRTWADMLAGRSWVDWVFMIALAAIAVALILGIGVTLAAIGGAILLLMIWAAGLPLGDNPFVNQHLIYALVLIGIAFTGAGLRYSLAPWWRRTALVRKLPFLR